MMHYAADVSRVRVQGGFSTTPSDKPANIYPPPSSRGVCSQPHQGDFFITARLRRRNLFLSSLTGEDAAVVALTMMRLPAVTAVRKVTSSASKSDGVRAPADGMGDRRRARPLHFCLACCAKCFA